MWNDDDCTTIAHAIAWLESMEAEDVGILLSCDPQVDVVITARTEDVEFHWGLVGDSGFPLTILPIADDFDRFVQDEIENHDAVLITPKYRHGQVPGYPISEVLVEVTFTILTGVASNALFQFLKDHGRRTSRNSGEFSRDQALNILHHELERGFRGSFDDIKELESHLIEECFDDGIWTFVALTKQFRFEATVYYSNTGPAALTKRLKRPSS